MYIYIDICIYIYVHKGMHMYMYIYICIYIYIHVCRIRNELPGARHRLRRGDRHHHDALLAPWAHAAPHHAVHREAW